MREVRSGWRAGTHRIGVATVASGLVFALVAQPALAVGPHTGVECQPTATEQDAALELAESCGMDVEITTARSPWSTFTATEEGKVSQEVTAVATRTSVSGAWGPVSNRVTDADPTDGMLAVTAPVYPITLSDGTAGRPLATINKDGHTLTYDSPFDLTEPVVDGDTVTYPGVAGKGADLVVTINSDGTGISTALRLADRAAALRADKKIGLGELTFPVTTSAGLTVTQNAAGGFDVVDAFGEDVFRAPEPKMWDSSASGAPDESAAGSGLFSSGATQRGTKASAGPTPAARWDQVSGEDADDPAARATAPLHGDEQVSMPVDLVPAKARHTTGALTSGTPADAGTGAGALSGASAPGTDLTGGLSVGGESLGGFGSAGATEPSTVGVRIRPDRDFLLSDPDTVFPALIDPTVTSAGNEWLMVHEGTQDATSGYMFEGNQGLGLCDVAVAASCLEKVRFRLGWQFAGLDHLGLLEPAAITSATFSVYGDHSWDCTARTVRLYGTKPIDAASNWDNWGAPPFGTELSRVTVAHKEACDNAGWVDFDATTGAKNLAATDTGTLSLGLVALNETDMTQGWKRYRHDAKLTVEYEPPAVSANAEGADLAARTKNLDPAERAADDAAPDAVTPTPEPVAAPPEPTADPALVPVQKTPDAAEATLPVPETLTAVPDTALGGLDLKIGAPAPAAGTPEAASEVHVEVADQATAIGAGISGVLLDVTDTSAEAPPENGVRQVQVQVDYDKFTDLAGADWSGRLGIVRIPECHATTPDLEECSPTPVDSTNNATDGSVTATLDLAAAGTPAAAAGAAERSATTETQVGALAAGGGDTFAVTAGTSSGAGDFGATPLSSASSWSVSGGTGSLGWSYPIQVPSPAAGPSPELAIGYSSASLDGRVSSTNNQSSWVGDGWDMTSGFVERRYVPCSEDRDESGGQNPNNASRKTGDLCWDSDNAFLVFNGTSSALVKKDDADTTDAIEWRPESDDGTLVQQYGRPTGTAATTDAGWAGEYWKVTTTDGTVYFFGKDGRYSGDTLAQNSRWTVPVYSNHPNEPGYKSAFAESGRQMGWRFNLDYVRDTSDNTMTYRYESETNRYGANNNTGATRTYTRGGTLDWISYGTRAGSEPVSATGAGAPNLVAFATAERCLVAATDCENADRGTTAGAVRWHDTPVDLLCSSSTSCPDVRSPAFFSTKRLTTVVTKVNVGGTLTAKDSVALTQTWRDPGDGTGRILWLDAIRRTANGPSSSTSDDVVFDPIRFTGNEQMPGRVADTVVDGLPAMNRIRVEGITTETGATIAIKYTPTECTAALYEPVAQGYISTAHQSANEKRCFPVVWHPWGMPEPRSEYFHSYMVSKVTQSAGQTGAFSVDVVTSYAYGGGIEWARIDDPLTPKKDRTYSINRGYETVTTTTGSDSVAAKTKTRYLQGTGKDINLELGSITTRGVRDHERFAGMPVTSTVVNGQTGVSKTITIPEAEETARTGSAGTDDLLVATRTARMDVYTASYTADGTQEYVTRTDTEYGDHGEVTKVNDYGAFSETADDNTTSDDLCITTGYLKDSAKHFVVPITTKTVSVRCAITETTPDQLIGASKISYDDPGDRGLPTSVKTNDKDGALNNASPTVHTVYDDRGRVESSTDPLGRVSETRYTESHGVPATVTTKSPDPDGAGDGDGDGVTLTAHESTTALHPLLGVPTKVSDPNNRLTTASYDAAGRLLSVNYPDRQGESANVTYAYSTSRTGVNAVTTRTLAADGVKYHVSVALYDGLLRPIQTQTESLDGDEEAVNGRLITDTEYDVNGRVWFTTSGWFATGKPSTTLVGAAVEPDATTVFTYDGLGRVRTEALFTGNISNAAYERWRTTTHYDGATTTVIPPDGATPTQTKVDARGRTVALSQFLRDPVKDLSVRTLAGVLDLDEQTTKYEYDKAGRLSKVFDPDMNEWEYRYDKLGRQVVAIDPDAGKTETEYDAAGQVTWVMNGANQKLHYTYDQLGRRKTVRQDTATTGTLRAKWTYDVLTSYAGTNPPSAKGQVTSSTRVAPSADGSGEFVTALTGFDAAYRPTGTVTVIPDTTQMAGLKGSYEQKVTYTADGQVASTTYPAAGGLSKETVTTHFDEETSVAEWMGGGFGWGTYVASSRTDVFGRLSYLDLGNTYGTVVSYGYEVGTSRLMNVKLDRERIGGTELDIRYAYDDAGNVLSAKDKPTAAGRAADQQCYQYDALRRLTEAWTPATGNCALAKSPAALGGSAPYWASFEYDDVLGNRTDETYRTRGLAGDVDGGVTTQRGYDYEGSRDLNADGDSTDAGEFAGPHAVTSITTDGPSGSTETSFTYDNAGRTRTQTQDSDYLTTKLSLGWDHETELASTSTATTVYPEPEPGSGDDDSDGDQSSGTGPDRGTGTTATVTGRNLYTADGDRLVRTAPDGTITVYLGGQEITKAPNGTVTGARYYSFAGQTVAMRTANGLGGVTSLINDPQGTALASVHNTNWTTSSVAKHYTLPFGEQRGGDSAPGDHEFLGKVRDASTGLTLVGARWYDETVGRFLSVDPVMDLADPQQWNGYAYANNNPTTYSDPSGLLQAPRPTIDGDYRLTQNTNRAVANRNSGWNINLSGALGRVVSSTGLKFILGVVGGVISDIASAPSVADATCPIGGCSTVQDKIVVPDIARMNQDTGAVSVTRPTAPSPATGGAGSGNNSGNGGIKTTFADPEEEGDDDEADDSRTDFFTVQGPHDAARLASGGQPFPTDPFKAHLGPGVYSWGSKAEAVAYAANKSGTTIMRFSVNNRDLAGMSQAHVGRMTDRAAAEFVERHSSIYGDGARHGLGYISRPTSKGTEHFFSADVFNLLRWH
ncbi:RHS repeat-associated core domain-containing protein [Promicromonospora sp. NPDC023805]|uniref:RHS repeat-associated core domain-containing protein n=1 Tax=Promicromonospora sp. NPDC023805 TaxID=3154696 RepID=UPI0033CD995E